MIEKLRALCDMRLTLAGFKFQIAESEKQLAATPKAQALAEQRRVCTVLEEKVRVVETEIKDATLSGYQRAGEKHPWPGVTVKLFNQYLFDEVEAIDWCFAKAKGLLRLDKGFIKAALPMGAPIRTLKEPRVQIDTDLSVVLKDWLE